ncbi:MAG TPA: hypothetical protein VKV79_05600 [Terriglobia bacterium]|nr:hypothetical protein [Terriglobia bacterium]
MRFFSDFQVLRSDRRTILCSIGIVLLAAVSLRPAIAQKPLAVASHIDPAAQALIDQAVQALGGPAFLNFKTMSTVGRAFSIADGVTEGFVHYESQEEFPNKRRLAYGLGKKKEITLINDSSQGWEIDRYGLIEQTGKQIRAWRLANRYEMVNVLRRIIHEPGTLIQNGGQDFVNNHAASIVDILDAHQVDIKLYLDAGTHLPIRIAYRLLNPKTHEWDDHVEVYADYQQVQGITTPMHLVRYLDGDRTAETFRFRVEYGETYPPGTFQAPE